MVAPEHFFGNALIHAESTAGMPGSGVADAIQIEQCLDPGRPRRLLHGRPRNTISQRLQSSSTFGPKMLRYPGRLALTSVQVGGFFRNTADGGRPVYLGIKQFFKMSMDTGQSEKQINQDDLMPFRFSAL